MSKKNFIGNSLENQLKVCSAIDKTRNPNEKILIGRGVESDQLLEIILSEFSKGGYVKRVQTGSLNYCAFLFGDTVVYGVCDDQWEYDLDRSYYLNEEESAKFIKSYKKQTLDLKINKAYELLSQLDIENDPRYDKKQFISHVLNNSSIIKEVSKENISSTKELYTYTFDDQILSVAKSGRLIIYDENFDIRYNEAKVNIGNSNLKKEATKEFVEILNAYENLTETDFKEFIEILMGGIRETKEDANEDLKVKPIYKLCHLLKINPSIYNLEKVIRVRLNTIEPLRSRVINNTVTYRTTYKIGDDYFRIDRKTPFGHEDTLLLDTLEFLTPKKHVVEIKYFEEDELPEMKSFITLHGGLDYANLDLFKKD